MISLYNNISILLVTYCLCSTVLVQINKLISNYISSGKYRIICAVVADSICLLHEAERIMVINFSHLPTKVYKQSVRRSIPSHGFHCLCQSASLPLQFLIRFLLISLASSDTHVLDFRGVKLSLCSMFSIKSIRTHY